MTDLTQTIAGEVVEKPLLLALIRRDPEPLAAVVRGDVALWEAVCARAGDHRCLPYLNWVLDQNGVAPPVAFAPALRQRWILRSLAIQRECLRLHRILADAGIAHLFLKGVPLAITAYPESWLRPVRDIDLLVAAEDLTRAQALLLAHGGPIERYAHRLDERVDPKAKHLVPVWSPGQVIAVELHGHATEAGTGPLPQTSTCLDAMLWASATDISLGDTALPVPGPEALFVHLVLHGIYDHELNNGPLFVLDLIHLLERMAPDPRRVVELAEYLGITRGLALALSLVPERTVGRSDILNALKGADTPDCLPTLGLDRAAALLLQDSAARTELRMSADLSAGSGWQRMRLLAGKILASRKTMTTRWRMEGHTAPPPASFPRLWCWFVWTRVRGLRRTGSAHPRNRDHLLHLRSLRDGKGA